MMTLYEVIEHVERVAANCDSECSEDYRQLAEWLRELQALRAAVFGFERMYNQLKAENARLRDAINYLYGFARTLGVDEGDMRGFGIEVDDD
jgi:hypothetical protein